MTARMQVGLLLVLMVFAAACGPRRAQVDNDDPARAPAEVTVVNRAHEHLTIYVFRGAERVRLGVVSPGMDETFRIPARLIIGVTRLRFVAELPGGRGPAMVADHNVAPGSHVEVIVR